MAAVGHIVHVLLLRLGGNIHRVAVVGHYHQTSELDLHLRLCEHVAASIANALIVRRRGLYGLPNPRRRRPRPAVPAIRPPTPPPWCSGAARSGSPASHNE